MNYYPFLLCLFFILLWAGFVKVRSVLGGWVYLSRKYPGSNISGEVLDKFHWKSITLGVYYSRCVNITITSNGIRLETHKLYSIFHNPIFVKWEEMKNPRVKQIIVKKVNFKIDGFLISI